MFLDSPPLALLIWHSWSLSTRRPFRPASQPSETPHAAMHPARGSRTPRPIPTFDHVSASGIKNCLNRLKCRKFWNLRRPSGSRPSGLRRLRDGAPAPGRQPEILGFFRGHIGIAVELLFNGLDRLAGMLGVNLVQPALQLDDFLCMAGDVGGLAVKGRRRLVDHDAGIGQGRSARPSCPRRAAARPPRRPGRCRSV